MGAFRQYHKHQAKEKINTKAVENINTKPAESDEMIWRPWEASGKLVKLSFNCPFSDCPGTFKRESELKRHEHSIHDKNTETCVICLKVFTRKDNLTRHMKMKHKNSDHKPKCRFCKKELSRLDAVKRHILTCLKNPCKPIYGVPFKELQSQNNRPWNHKCHMCSKTYARKDNLQRHQKVHKDKVLHCPVCRKVFASVRTDSLLRHRSSRACTPTE